MRKPLLAVLLGLGGCAQQQGPTPEQEAAWAERTREGIAKNHKPGEVYDDCTKRVLDQEMEKHNAAMQKHSSERCGESDFLLAPTVNNAP